MLACPSDCQQFMLSKNTARNCTVIFTKYYKVRMFGLEMIPIAFEENDLDLHIAPIYIITRFRLKSTIYITFMKECSVQN